MAKIIVIDDEPAMVEVIVTLCREKGHEVFPFNSAPKAVEQLDSIQPQIVITGFRCRCIDGLSAGIFPSERTIESALDQTLRAQSRGIVGRQFRSALRAV